MPTATESDSDEAAARPVAHNARRQAMERTCEEAGRGRVAGNRKALEELTRAT